MKSKKTSPEWDSSKMLKFRFSHHFSQETKETPRNLQNIKKSEIDEFIFSDCLSLISDAIQSTSSQIHEKTAKALLASLDTSIKNIILSKEYELAIYLQKSKKTPVEPGLNFQNIHDSKPKTLKIDAKKEFLSKKVKINKIWNSIPGSLLNSPTVIYRSPSNYLNHSQSCSISPIENFKPSFFDFKTKEELIEKLENFREKLLNFNLSAMNVLNNDAKTTEYERKITELKNEIKSLTFQNQKISDCFEKSLSIIKSLQNKVETLENSKNWEKIRLESEESERLKKIALEKNKNLILKCTNLKEQIKQNKQREKNDKNYLITSKENIFEQLKEFSINYESNFKNIIEKQEFINEKFFLLIKTINLTSLKQKSLNSDFLSRISQEKKELTEENNQIKELLLQKTKTLQESEKKIENFNKVTEESLKIIEKLSTETQKKSNKIRDQQVELFTLKNSSNAVNLSLITLQTENTQLLFNINNLEKNNLELAKENKKLKKKLEKHEKNFEENIEKLQIFQKNEENLKTQIKECENTKNTLISIIELKNRLGQDQETKKNQEIEENKTETSENKKIIHSLLELKTKNKALKESFLSLKNFCENFVIFFTENYEEITKIVKTLKIFEENYKKSFDDLKAKDDEIAGLYASLKKLEAFISLLQNFLEKCKNSENNLNIIKSKIFTIVSIIKTNFQENDELLALGIIEKYLKRCESSLVEKTNPIIRQKTDNFDSQKFIKCSFCNSKDSNISQYKNTIFMIKKELELFSESIKDTINNTNTEILQTSDQISKYLIKKTTSSAVLKLIKSTQNFSIQSNTLQILPYMPLKVSTKIQTLTEKIFQTDSSLVIEKLSNLCKNLIETQDSLQNNPRFKDLETFIEKFLDFALSIKNNLVFDLKRLEDSLKETQYLLELEKYKKNQIFDQFQNLKKNEANNTLLIENIRNTLGINSTEDLAQCIQNLIENRHQNTENSFWNAELIYSPEEEIEMLINASSLRAELEKMEISGISECSNLTVSELKSEVEKKNDKIKEKKLKIQRNKQQINLLKTELRELENKKETEINSLTQKILLMQSEISQTQRFEPSFVKEIFSNLIKRIPESLKLEDYISSVYKLLEFTDSEIDLIIKDRKAKTIRKK